MTEISSSLNNKYDKEHCHHIEINNIDKNIAITEGVNKYDENIIIVAQ